MVGYTYNTYFVENFVLSLSVKESWKSINFSRSYRWYTRVSWFFDSQCIHTFKSHYRSRFTIVTDKQLECMAEICLYVVRRATSPCMWIVAYTVIVVSGGGSSMRVGGNPVGLGDGSPTARSRGGAPVGGLGDEVPQKLKVFRKNMCKIWSNMAKIFKEFWQFYKQYILFVVRLTTSEKSVM